PPRHLSFATWLGPRQTRAGAGPIAAQSPRPDQTTQRSGFGLSITGKYRTPPGPSVVFARRLRSDLLARFVASQLHGSGRVGRRTHRIEEVGFADYRLDGSALQVVGHGNPVRGVACAVFGFQRPLFLGAFKHAQVV